MSESNFTLEQVELQLKKIQSKHESRKKNNKKLSGQNLKDSLEHLDQELDYLNVSYLSESLNPKSIDSVNSVLSELVNSTFDLIRLHKDLLKQQDELIEKNSRLSSDNTAMKKQIDSLRKDVASKERLIEIARGKHHLETRKNDELTNKIGQANKRIGIMQQENRTNRDRQIQLIKKANNENKIKNNKLAANCGKYISQDKKLIDILEKHQKQEEILQETIHKLQNTNQHLLQEVLELRNELTVKK